MDDTIVLLVVLILFFAIAPYGIQRILIIYRQNIRANQSEATKEAFALGIRTMVKSNDIATAIKAYQDYHQASPTEAKEAIIAMKNEFQDTTESSITRSAIAKIVKLVRQGKTDEAIEIYKSTTGSDLTTAKRAIAQMQQADINLS